MDLWSYTERQILDIFVFQVQYGSSLLKCTRTILNYLVSLLENNTEQMQILDQC